MLKKIKPLFFIRKLFMLVDEGKKLKILRYNKELQNTIEISFTNYKHFRGIELIYESNGLVKEIDYSHDDGSLIYEGEYLNGKRNGKGKELYSGKIDYEGEYKDGKRSGKGREYFYNNKLKFEGEYRNGKRNGEGKEYYDNGVLKFEGVYLNDNIFTGIKYDNNGKMISKINNSYGLVKEYNIMDRLKFEGEYINGIRNGKGKEYYFGTKLKFEGEYLNGKRNGNGKEYYCNKLIFEGK